MSQKPYILFVSTFYPREDLLQYCQFVHEEAKALLLKGYHITVINPRTDIKESRQWTLDDIPILCLPYHSWRTNYSYLANSYFLFHALRTLGESYFRQFDFIHVHNCLPEGNALLLLKKAFRLNMPMAVQVHDPNIYKCAYIRLRAAQCIFKNRCIKLYHEYDYCIGVSNPVSDLIRQGLPDREKQKVLTAYNGYNPAIFNRFGRTDARSVDSCIRILFVGNLIEWKGIRDLIHGYCQCYSRFSYPTELWILGRGILQQELEDLVHDYHMEEHVSFKGYVPAEQVALYMKQCHIYAMPSTFEGFGCVYLEAMACGLPCIACTDQGISEIIEQHDAGILIPPHSLDGLKESLLTLVNDPDSLNNYVEHINSFITEHTWNEAVTPIAELYSSSFSAAASSGRGPESDSL